eukprot:1766008-Rhodomonas_salina.2
MGAMSEGVLLSWCVTEHSGRTTFAVPMYNFKVIVPYLVGKSSRTFQASRTFAASAPSKLAAPLLHLPHLRRQ